MPQLSDVFLSCCETNLGMTKITDDILTLGTGFLCAGARSVVSTLWAVDDLATALFSIFYYKYRKAGLSRPEALRRTQKKLRTISGKELEEKYQEKLNPIMENIIEKLQKELAEVRAKIKDLKEELKSIKDLEFKKILKEENRKKTVEEKTINNTIKFYQTLYQESTPFEHLKYWSAFICQGLP
jgi:CHAT domain-containing protein